MPVVVSVIIAAYNAEAFIAEAVRSALAQTLADIEVLVVDDGSRDRTLDVAREAAAGDPRCRLFEQPRNSGVAAARNVALREARGRWIAVLDADDTYLRERLERLVAAAERTGADLLADDITLVDADGRTALAFAIKKRDENVVVDARRFVALDTPGLENLPAGFMKPLMRRECLERFGIRYPEDISVGEDFDVYVRCLLHGARLFFVHASYYRALVRLDSLSRANPKSNNEALLRSLDRLTAEAQRLRRPDVARMLARRAHDLAAYHEYSRLSDALHHRRPAEAIQLFTRLARGSYVWRRFGMAARRRVLRRTSIS